MGRHRKTMPTFSEKGCFGVKAMRRTFRVFDTDIGRIGGLICGEHIMTLMRAAMIGLGEDIHIAAFPTAFSWRRDRNSRSGTLVTRRFGGIRRFAPHALEAGAFVHFRVRDHRRCRYPG